MARVAIVSHDVQTVLNGRAGGVGAFVTHLATLLRRHGDSVTIILTRQEVVPVRVDEPWRRRYEELGIGLIEVHSPPPSPERWSDAWPLRLSEVVTPLLDGFDIAYFQDWANVAFQAARINRFRAPARPVLVTVLHGPSAWVRRNNRQYPFLPEDLHVEYIERYSAEHSDFVVAPSRYIKEWAEGQAWRFPKEPNVLGLPYLPNVAETKGPVGPLRRIVFFGRMETRKGFGIFTEAVRQLLEGNARAVEEVVLLGHEQESGSVSGVQRALEPFGIGVRHMGGLDSEAALRYLAANAHNSLAVIPSPVENFPYAVIETSVISGLNMICSSQGGGPEVLGEGAEAQLFEPHPRGLAEKLRERLEAPLGPDRLSVYDWNAANSRWISFHREALLRPPKIRPAATATVDVCTTFYNKGHYFEQLLESLENQTTQTFGVIAIDDGSPEPESRAIFDRMAERYRDRGWRFMRQANAYVDAARNRAAACSRADYLLFIDADDIPTPNMIERFMEAAAISGDDCLSSGGYLFESDGPPERLLARYLPLGPNLVAGLIDPIVLGLPLILIRRTVFEQLGGYRELRGVAHEDWELQVRLLLGGYSTDIVPECLLYFRRLASGLARTSEDYPAKHRLVDAYEQQLRQIGLSGAAGLIHALQVRCRELEKALESSPRPGVPGKLQQRALEMLARHAKDLRAKA